MGEKKLVIEEETLKKVTGGEILPEQELGSDDPECVSCGKFLFKSYENLNIPFCPQNCANAHSDSCRHS